MGLHSILRIVLSPKLLSHEHQLNYLNASFSCSTGMSIQDTFRYSAGNIIYYLFTSKFPSSHIKTKYSEIIYAINNGIYPQIPEETPSQISQLILALWSGSNDIQVLYTKVAVGILVDFLQVFFEKKWELDQEEAIDLVNSTKGDRIKSFSNNKASFLIYWSTKNNKYVLMSKKYRYLQKLSMVVDKGIVHLKTASYSICDFTEYLVVKYQIGTPLLPPQ